MLRRAVSQLGRDTVYVLLGFPVALAAFVVVVTMLATSLGLVVTLLGIPLLYVTLVVARGFGALERSRLVALGDRPVAQRLRWTGRRPGRWGWLARLRDGQAWLDILHAVLALPVSVATFAITLTWLVGAVPGILGSVTYPLWSRFLPENEVGDDTYSLAELLGLTPAWDWAVYLAVALVFLLTLAPVVRVCALAQSALARLLVANEQMASLRERVQTLTSSRAAVVEAGTATLQRLERDIHDGPQQRLVRLQMDLASAERRLTDDPDAARDLVVEAQGQVEQTLGELRSLSRGIAPPVLVDRGLSAALSALAARCTVEVSLDVRLPDAARRLPRAVETTAYFVVAEALTNVAKHSAATECRVTVNAMSGSAATGGSPPGSPGQAGSGEDAVVRVEVRDNGVGGASLAKGHGLAGLADRVAAVDGRLTVDSPAGGPTVLVAEIPVT